MTTPLLSCSQLELSYSDDSLFRELSFSLHSGDRVGLIGPNGAGKSTLLSLLSKKIEPDTGKVTHQKGLKLHLVQQSPSYPQEWTVGETIRKIIQEQQKSPVSLMNNQIDSFAEELSLTEVSASIASLSGGN